MMLGTYLVSCLYVSLLPPQQQSDEPFLLELSYSQMMTQSYLRNLSNLKCIQAVFHTVVKIPIDTGADGNKRLQISDGE